MVTSESTKTNGFRIYPGEEPDVDRLVTKALVLGDFDSAVALCLVLRMPFSLLFVVVLSSFNVLRAYFEQRTTSLPSFRLFQYIVTNK